MSKVTNFFLLASTGIMLVTFGQGLGVLQGGNVATHLQWSLIALLTVLMANAVAMVHATQSTRIIRELHRQLAAAGAPAPDDRS